VVGSNAVVPNGMEVPSGTMALGVPAKLREGAARADGIRQAAQHYVENGRRYKREMRRVD
jgi:carbonic anhydrase/acetyltransferase-like protein (isoleucine patch superfamily)